MICLNDIYLISIYICAGLICLVDFCLLGFSWHTVFETYCDISADWDIHEAWDFRHQMCHRLEFLKRYFLCPYDAPLSSSSGNYVAMSTFFYFFSLFFRLEIVKVSVVDGLDCAMLVEPWDGDYRFRKLTSPSSSIGNLILLLSTIP